MLLVLDGRLVLGATVPSERDLAAALGVSRTTVGTAYRTLVEEGYLATRERARATVRLPDDDKHVPTPRRTPTAIDLSFAAPQAPGEILHAAFVSALEKLPRHYERHGYDRYGIEELRDAVVRWYERRGLPTSRDSILVTSGAQHALALLARTMLAPRDRVVIDHPTYPHVITTLVAQQVRLVPVGLTAVGWDVEQLQTAGKSAKLAYLIPDFHNPTGLCMSRAVRQQLELACPTIVDETMVDICLDGAPPVPFALAQPDAISIGSVSKAFGEGCGSAGSGRPGASGAGRPTSSRPGSGNTGGRAARDRDPLGWRIHESARSHRSAAGATRHPRPRAG